MKLKTKNILSFFVSFGLMFLALYYLAEFDFLTSLLISLGASILTFLIPALKSKK